MSGQIEVLEATTCEEFAHAARFMRGFVALVRVRYRDDLWMVDTYFDAAAFEAELSSLPEKYAPPAGTVLLALVDGTPAGTVALQAYADDICEVKRLFVDPSFHGRGVGRRLMQTLMDLAKQRGYPMMRLETSTKLPEAEALYRSLGFSAIAHYNEFPHAFIQQLVSMQRIL